MKLSIESTDEITTLDGIPCRVWKGHTDEGKGVRCIAFIHRVAVNCLDDTSEFEADLLEQLPPRLGISEVLLLQAGAAPDELGRFSWPPIADRDSLTHLSALPLADGEWMLEIAQSSHDEPAPRYHTGIGLPVSTMSQLLLLLQSIRGSLIPSTEVESKP